MPFEVRVPRRWWQAALLLPAMLAAAAPASAQVFVPAPARKDMVYDEHRGLVYITAGDRVLRYSPKYGTFQSPLIFGGDLRGIDLSPDGRTLVVADGLHRRTSAGIWLVELERELVRQARFQLEWAESGTFSAVFGKDGKVYTTSSTTCDCSSRLPMRSYDPATGTWTTLASLPRESMLSPSGDGGTIAFAQVNTSDGAYGLYRVDTAALVLREGYSKGTSQFNWEIATNRTGTQFVLPTHGGAYVFGADYALLAKLGANTVAKAAGVAYHPVEAQFFLTMAYSGQVVSYNANTLAPTTGWPLFYSFALPSYRTIDAYDVARTRISRDGSLLMISVPGGVVVHRQYAPLQAAPVAIEMAAGASADLALAGSVGNGGAITYSLPDPPSQGSATLVGGSTLHYTAAANGSGWVHFRYRAHYGLSWTDGDAWIHVLPTAARGASPAALRTKAPARR